MAEQEKREVIHSSEGVKVEYLPDELFFIYTVFKNATYLHIFDSFDVTKGYLRDNNIDSDQAGAFVDIEHFPKGMTSTPLVGKMNATERSGELLFTYVRDTNLIIKIFTNIAKVALPSLKAAATSAEALALNKERRANLK